MLSVQLYSAREELAADRDGVIERLAEIGFDAIEPYQPLADPAGVRALADRLGLAIPSVHAMDVLGDDPDAVFEAANVLGAGLVVVPAGIPREDFGSTEGIERTAERLGGLAERAAGHGLRLGYHNHWWELEQLPGLEGLAAALDPAVVLEVDVYWVAVGGADAAAVLRRLGERVAAIHVKDGPLTQDAPNVAVGSGAMPIADVLAAAPPGALRVVEFDAIDGDIFEGLAASRAFLS